MTELSKKEEGFVKDYLETGNGTQAVLNNYDTEDPNTAGVIAWENLRKPKIQARLHDASDGAVATIVSLSQGADNENVRLAASKDILDRAGFKPVEKSINLNVTADISNPKAKELADKYEDELKKNL
jgi:phage terminase small subunit